MTMEPSMSPVTPRRPALLEIKDHQADGAIPQRWLGHHLLGFLLPFGNLTLLLNKRINMVHK